MKRWLLKQWYRLAVNFRVLASGRLERVQEVQWEVNGQEDVWEIGIETPGGFARFYSMHGPQVNPQQGE